MPVNRDAFLCLQVWRNDNLTVFRQMSGVVIVIDMVGRTCRFFRLGPGTEIAFAIDIADITASEHIAIAFCHALSGSNLSTIDINLGLSEHIAVGIECTLLTVAIEVIALAAAKHVALHMAVVHRDTGATSLIDTLQLTVGTFLHCHLATSDSGNLSTAMETVSYHTAPHRDIGEIHTAAHIIAAAKHITTVFQAILSLPLAGIGIPTCLIVNLFLIALYRCFIRGHDIPFLILTFIR